MRASSKWFRGRTVILPSSTVSEAKNRGYDGARNSGGRGGIFGILLKILAFFWRLFRRACVIVGFVAIISWIVIFAFSDKFEQRKKPEIGNNVILSFTLNGRLPEGKSQPKYMKLLGLEEEPLTLYGAVNAIEKAASDPRVKALVFEAESAGYDITQMQELRSAIMSFKKSGKKAYIYSESYGEGGYGLGLYYFASAFDEIWMQPVGVVAIGGISAEMPFFKGIMDRFGVEAQFFQRKEYKNAMEHLTATHMSPKSREETEGLIQNMALQLVAPIKRDRTKIVGNFDDWISKGLLTDDVALKAGLIDHLGYEEEIVAKLRGAYPHTQKVSIADYAESIAPDQMNSSEKTKKSSSKSASAAPKARVAVIAVEGMIVSGSVSDSPYGFDSRLAGAEDIKSAIEEAARQNYDAIILRINSPGGSPSASETIAHAVDWAQNTRKIPVYISMGSVAASGGYWVAAGAKKIYAMPATLTGSIGVVGGKINLQKLWEKYDVHWESVSYGQNAGMMSFNTPFSASEQAQFEASLDNVYAHFIARVKKGRKMNEADIEAIAKGHVWTGEQAKKNGLVDEIGGLGATLDGVAKDLGVKSRDDLSISYLPEQDDPLQIFYDLMEGQVSLSPMLDQLRASIWLNAHSPRMVYAPQAEFFR